MPGEGDSLDMYGEESWESVSPAASEVWPQRQEEGDIPVRSQRRRWAEVRETMEGVVHLLGIFRLSPLLRTLVNIPAMNLTPVTAEQLSPVSESARHPSSFIIEVEFTRCMCDLCLYIKFTRDILKLSDRLNLFKFDLRLATSLWNSTEIF